MANTVTVANLQADLSLNTGNFSEGVNNAAGATESLTGAILKADLVKGVLQGVANFAGEVAGIVKDAVGNFSEYEQLVGGVETLFGAGGMNLTEYAESVGKSVDEVSDHFSELKEAESMVIDNAQAAFRTVGIDANEYMANVTSFSASLLQSLGGDTKKAASVADMAMTDMADNANKMGTDMASIQNAYQGFAKQNYTMLDNLKLGYGGTKSEMERLLKDATELSGVKYDIENLSDVYEAIHVIQTEMGITGTTAKEAATTIQGSEKMMKASWQNLLTSMVQGGEWFDDCIDNFIESVQTYVGNLLPAIEGAMHGFAALISALAPMLAAELPAFVKKIIPDFITAVVDIIDGVLKALPELLKALEGVSPLLSDALVDLIPSLIDFILEGIPLLISAGITLLTSLVSGLADNIETIVPKLTQGVVDLVDQLITIIKSDGSNLASAGLALLKGLADALIAAVPDVLTQVTQMVQDLTDSISTAADGENESIVGIALDILTDLATGLSTSIATVLPDLVTAVSAFITAFAGEFGKNTTTIINAAIGILGTLIDGLSSSLPTMATDITTAVMAIIDAIIDVITGLDITTFADACASIVGALADGITGAVSVITAKLPDLITKIVAWLTNPENLTGLLTAALDIFGTIVSDIPSIVTSLTTGLAGIVSGIAKYFKDNGDDILQGIKDGFTQVGAKITEVWTEKIKPAFDTLGTNMKNFFSQFDWGQALIDFIESIKTAFSGIWDKVKEFFTGGEGLATQIKNFFSNFEWGISLITFVNKIGNAFSGIWEKVKKYFEGEGSFKASITNFFTSFDWGETLSNFVGNIANAFGGLWDSVKEKIEAGWSSFRSWFDGKISSLLDGVKDINIFGWKPFGGSDDTESGTPAEPGAEPVEGEETLVDMPSNMITLDYGNLEPIPMETLESYQLFAESINAINTAISGGEDSVGLSAALDALPEKMAAVLTAAQELAGYLAEGFVAAINTLMMHVCMTSEDEEGNIDASGGNTLYNAMGSIYGLFQDIYATSQLLAQYWSTEFINASEMMRTEAGHAVGALLKLSATAQNTMGNFLALADAIYAVIGAYLELQAVTGHGGGGSIPSPIEGFAAEGGPVIGGLTYVVGEKGPELFTPRQNGWITSNDDLMAAGKKEINIYNNFSADVIGDQQSLSDYVTKATNKALEEAVYAAV